MIITIIIISIINRMDDGEAASSFAKLLMSSDLPPATT